MAQTPRNPIKIAPDLIGGQGVIGLGDSIIAGSEPGGVGNRWFDLMTILTDGRVPYLYNKGVGGQTVAQIMARIDADVLPYHPSHVVLCGGTNSWGDAPFQPVIDTYTAGLVKLRNHGIEPIPCLPPPRTNIGTSSRISQMTFNAWLRSYCKQHGMHLIDLFTPLANVDPAAGPRVGDYAVGMGNASESVANGGSGEVHMSITGAKTVATLVAAQLAPLFPLNAPYLAGRWGSTDDISLIPDGNFAVDTNADGVADNWSVSHDGGTVVASRVQDAANKWWQRLDVQAAPATFAQLSRSVTFSMAPGDEIELNFRMKVTNNESGSGGFQWRFNWGNGTPNLYAFYSYFPYDITEHIVSMRTTVPPGTTTCGIIFGWSRGTFRLDVADVTVINRTRLGLAA